MTVHADARGQTLLVTIDRPQHRNAVDRATADRLADVFRSFDTDESLRVAILTGSGGHFCAGADLQAIAAGQPNRLCAEGDGPMGPTRMLTHKPVIAAIAGHAVAGGLELAAWCDLRVVEESAIMGVFCRRWGVPLIDGGTLRLPRIIGLGRALDLILTGRPVYATEALQIGLATRVVPDGTSLESALELAQSLAAFPQGALRADRISAYRSFSETIEDGLVGEFARGVDTLEEGKAGATLFRDGAGRHGQFED